MDFSQNPGFIPPPPLASDGEDIVMSPVSSESNAMEVDSPPGEDSGIKTGVLPLLSTTPMVPVLPGEGVEIPPNPEFHHALVVRTPLQLVSLEEAIDQEAENAINAWALDNFGVDQAGLLSLMQGRGFQSPFPISQTSPLPFTHMSPLPYPTQIPPMSPLQIPTQISVQMGSPSQDPPL